MSKERLESLKRNREWTEATGGKFYTVDSDDYKWLIEQAERVQELEEEVERYQSGRNVAVITKMKMDELEKQNKRYREALIIISANLPLDGKEDYVYIARQALKDENKEIKN